MAPDSLPNSHFECKRDEAFVYVMAKRLDDGWEGPCKIGLARNPQRRLVTLATSSPFPMALYGAIGPLPRPCALQLERAFHGVKNTLRLHGEWFHVQPKEALCSLVIGMAALLEAHVQHVDFTRDRGFHCATDHVWCAEM